MTFALLGDDRSVLGPALRPDLVASECDVPCKAVQVGPMAAIPLEGRHALLSPSIFFPHPAKLDRARPVPLRDLPEYCSLL